jgi:branched-chain amino acid transport system substrate-binding protein
MKRKKIVLWSVVLALLWAITAVPFLSGAACKPEAPAVAGKPILIGYSNSVTGIYSGMGESGIKGLQTAVFLINELGGIAGHPVFYTAYDSASDVTTATTNFKKLVDVNKVHIIWAESSTGLSVPQQKWAVESKIPFWALSGSEYFDIAAKQAGYHSWNFRPHVATFADTLFGHALFLKKDSGPNIAIIHADTAYGKTMADALAKLAPYLDMNVVLRTSYPGDATEFSALIAQVKAHPEIGGITVEGAELASALAVAALREAGVTVPIEIPYSITTPEIMALEKVRKGYEGPPGVLNGADYPVVWSSLPVDHPQRKVLEPFAVAFEKQWGRKLTSSFESEGWEYMTILKAALEPLFKAQPDILDKDLATIRAAFRDASENNVKNVVSGEGIVTITPENHCGLVLGTGLVCARFVDGKWVYLPDYTYTVTIDYYSIP